jgi:DNA gyrase inhibitor GyrI
MSDLEVRIVELQPMRVASAWGFGKEPEGIAFSKLNKWARPKGFLDDPQKHRIFGFNNPDPSPGSPNYGYEVWIEVGPEVEPEGDIRIVSFRGGLYAVTRCEVPKGDFEVIGATWKQLVTWREDSKYKYGPYQWLEQSIVTDNPGLEFILDLFMPIAE